MYGSPGMYGGGGQGSQMQMMSSMCGSSVCLLLLAGGAFMLMNRNKGNTSSDYVVPMPAPAETAPSDAVSGLDGSFAILIGSLALSVKGSCDNNNVLFRTPNDSKTSWNIRKAGTSSDGKDYYTLQSVWGSFNTICKKQYLTAPSGCKGPPYLAEAQSNPQQYWYIEGSPERGFTLRSMGCALSRFPYSYMESSGQIEGKPSFSARTGTPYRLETPFAG